MNMTTVDVIEITRDALILTLKLSVPVMVIALIVGLIVSLFQALTQIQEMTLAFIPKIIAVFGSLIFLMPFMVRSLTDFSMELFNRIAGGGGV